MRIAVYSKPEPAELMTRGKLTLLFAVLSMLTVNAQDERFTAFLNDSVMKNASVSFVVAEAGSGNIVWSFNPDLNLIPASTLKLVTSATAIELLGPQYTFRTKIAYTGILNKRSGVLDGDLVIKGGGDPCLGSDYFSYHYGDFIGSWAEAVKNAGIKKIRGRVITDDSYFDYEPAAPRWMWEDMGVSYGAGVYGLSVFDNTCSISVRFAPGSPEAEITGTTPELPQFSFTSRLKRDAGRDNWYVYSVPYSNSGWLSGTIVTDTSDCTLDGSIPDPPLLAATMLNKRLIDEGIKVAGMPSTVRIEKDISAKESTLLTETVSPLLSQITDRLNKESINLYAEHYVKELGKQFRGTGSTTEGLKVIREFIAGTGTDTTALFLEDGSGLSARNGISAAALTKLLVYMKNKGSHFQEFYSSLPERGGTSSTYFADPLFESNLKAKSGSMTRVRCYAGYFTTQAGNDLVFCILVNNFRGSSPYIINNIEAVLKDFILYK